ncbi:MAG: hypothetical protein ACRDPW_09455 [Mycobacteriales bacterium]
MLDWCARLRTHVLARPVGAALLLVSVNVVTRLVLRFVSPDDQADLMFGLVTYGVVLLTMAVFTGVWVRRFRLARVWTYLISTVLAAAIVIGVFGPWVSGEAFGDGDLKLVVLRILLTFVVLAAGGIIGMLSAVALGQDPTSRAWKAHADQVLGRRK